MNTDNVFQGSFETPFDLVCAFSHYTNVRLSAHFSFKQLRLWFQGANVRLGFHYNTICIFFSYLFFLKWCHIWDNQLQLSCKPSNQTNLSFTVREHLSWHTQRLFTPNTLVLHRSALQILTSRNKWRPAKVSGQFTPSVLPHLSLLV